MADKDCLKTEKHRFLWEINDYVPPKKQAFDGPIHSSGAVADKYNGGPLWGMLSGHTFIVLRATIFRTTPVVTSYIAKTDDATSIDP